MKYLLDTNVLSAVATNKSEPLLSRFRSTPRQDLATCDVVLHEVQFGLAANPVLARKLSSVYDTLLSGLIILATDQFIWRRAATIRATLKLRGAPIGPYDLLIAAVAAQHNLTLVTNNLREFEHVDGLQIEDWSRAS
jgi:tRNA(fMet)-specific endonuclease VapC